MVLQNEGCMAGGDGCWLNRSYGRVCCATKLTISYLYNIRLQTLDEDSL